MSKTYSTEEQKEKAIIIGVSFNKMPKDVDLVLSELESLCFTANLEVVGKAFQNIQEHTPATLLGKGKVEEIRYLIEELGADVAVVDTELTGSQISNLSDVWNVKVIDRSMLILDIFAGRAKTNEGRLQVKLAQLKYTLPRISGISGTSGRFGGGVGMRGPGETKLELDKRTIRDNIVKHEKEIEKVKSQRDVQKSSRKKNNMKMVAIVGYTNAGKSTLMNTITKAGIYADNKLFATLDTTTRNVWLGNNKQIVLTDTVGFIDKLPHAFIEAFSATLEEARDADLLLHVVDITDPNYRQHIEVVDKVLKDLGAENIERILIYNKIDDNKKPFVIPEDVLCISARKNLGIEELKQEIQNRLFKD